MITGGPKLHHNCPEEHILSQELLELMSRQLGQRGIDPNTHKPLSDGEEAQVAVAGRTHCSCAGAAFEQLALKTVFDAFPPMEAETLLGFSRQYC